MALESFVLRASLNSRMTTPGALPNRWPAMGCEDVRTEWARAGPGIWTSVRTSGTNIRRRRVTSQEEL